MWKSASCGLPCSPRFLNILFVIEHYPPYIGGVEKLFSSLAGKLVERGHNVRVITTRFHPSLPRHEVMEGVEVFRVTSNRFIFSLVGVFQVYKLSKGFDLFHTSSYNAAFPSFIASLLRRKKAIITFHELWGKLWFTLPFLYFPSRFIFWTYEQSIIRLPFHKFIGVSEFTSGRLRKIVPAGRVFTIYNGISYDVMPTFTGLGNKEFTFIYFGRIGVSKGIDLIIKASAMLAQQGVKHHLKLIIPQIPVYFYVKVIRLLKRKGIYDDVTIVHHLPEQELQRELLSSDCVLIPSYSEGFCFAAVEAAAMGLPIISSGRGALSEVVSGTFIEMEEQSARGLAGAMQKAMRGEWRRTDLKQFDLSKQVDEYLNLYSEIAEEL